MPTLATPSTVTFSLQVDQILTLTNNFGAGRVVLSAQRGGDVVFSYTGNQLWNAPVFSAGSQGIVTITHLSGRLTYDVNTSVVGLDSSEVVAARSLTLGVGTGVSAVTYDVSNRCTGFMLGTVSYTITGWGGSTVTVAGSDGSSRAISLDGSGRISGVS
jgi:hypothetical protein